MIVKEFFIEPIRHLYKLLNDPNYRTYCFLASKLGKMGRYKECRVRVHDWELLIPDAASFLSTYRELFVQEIYKFSSKSDQPHILDLGANIGLSILYFKTIYPGAKITAYEADPKIFRYLENNIRGNGFLDVELINKAVWDKNDTLMFLADGADGGRIVGEAEGHMVEVDAVDIKQCIDGRVEFLKMDIEGAEESVFPELKGRLDGVRFIFLEYHSTLGRMQKLHTILKVMADEGFRVDVQNVMASGGSPFVRPLTLGQFDTQLNIFARRE